MKEKEFNLKEKRVLRIGLWNYPEKHVKEFIKILKERYDILHSHLAHTECKRCHEELNKFRDLIDKLSGGL